MSDILLNYKKIDPTTWAYLASILMIGVYFKFNRVWSVRNLDLALLILFAPGLLLVYNGRTQWMEASWASDSLQKSVVVTPISNLLFQEEIADPPPQPPMSPEKLAGDLAKRAPGLAPRLKDLPHTEALQLAKREFENGKMVAWLGYVWLFVVSGVWLVRLLLDPTMVRRPLLEPNLSLGGLAFLGACLFLFLMANVIVGTPSEDDLKGPKGVEDIINLTDNGRPKEYHGHGPGFVILSVLPSISTMPFVDPVAHPNQRVEYAAAAKVMAVLAHLAVVAGLMLIGYLHFDNLRTGIGVATLYLLLPYTSQTTGHLSHVLPAALLLWAVALYRRPLTAGILIGLAMGVCYYPFFLLPLWLSFYWHRGLVRFSLGVAASVVVMAVSLLFVSENVASFWEKIQAMFGLWTPAIQGLAGIWSPGWWDPIYRLPVLTAFVLLSISMAAWPAQKNLGTLLSCSAALMLATQFWHRHEGGTFLAWYLPLLLLTVFRPNLEDRVALSVLGESWLERRRVRTPQLDRAA